MGAVARGKLRIEPLPPDLLGDPLDFFFAEHFRQRQLCNCIKQLAETAAFDEALAAEILAFLKHDLPLHIADEEEDLFPLLRRRCPPEDEIDRVLVMLSGEHETDRDLAGLIKSGLEAALEDGKPISAYAGLHQTMTEFARNEGRHLALENSIVLPLARLRLTDHDLDLLSRHLIQRRQGQAPA